MGDHMEDGRGWHRLSGPGSGDHAYLAVCAGAPVSVAVTWAIDEDDWHDLVGRLPAIPGPQHPELGDRKRQIASIYVWVQLTSGEHHFAPRPIEDAQPLQIQQEWKNRRNTIWHLMQSDRRRPHYTDLKTELNALAGAIARRNDSTPT
jgi:hypothetical protein